MKKLIAVAALATLAAFLLGACGAAEEATPTATTPPAAAKATATTPAAKATATTPPATPVAAPVLTASEVILKAAQEMGVPMQLPQPPSPYAPKVGGHVDLVTNGWPFPRYWNWPVNGAYSNMYISLYAETLVTFPQGPGTNPADYTPQPLLAESWEISNGGKTYTFQLRKGVKFNSDTVDVDTTRDVTAHDWVDLAAVSFGVPTSRFKSRYPAIAGPESWKALDDYTLQVTLNTPVASFLYSLAVRGPQMYGLQGAQQRMAKEGVDIEEAMKSDKVQVGTGPWLLTEWTADVSVKYTKNPVYWQKDKMGNQLPFIDTVEMFVMKDERAQDAGFRTGKLGAIALETCGMSTERYYDITKTNPDTVWEIFVDPTNMRAVYMNYAEGTPWQNQKVRQAMALSVDKVGWVKSVLGGWGLPFNTPLAPGNQYWLPPGQYPDVDGDGVSGDDLLAYDVAKAKKLMQEAGYGGGIKGTYLLTNDLGARFFSEAELTVEAFRQIGIDTVIQVKDGAERQATYESGQFDLMFGFPGYGWDPADWLYRAYHSRMTSDAYGPAALKDPVLDAKIDAEEAEVDPAKRWEIVADIQRYVMDKHYYTMGTDWMQIVAIAPWLKNYQYQYSYPIGQGLALAWLDR